MNRTARASIGLLLAFAVGLPAAALGQTEGSSAERAKSATPAQASPPEASAAPAEQQEPASDARPGPPPDQVRPNFREIILARKTRQIANRMNSRISRYLSAAMEAQEEESAEAGLELLERLNLKRLNPMERASVYRVEAMLHYVAGDTEETIQGFRNAIDEEILPLTDEIQIRFNIAQLLTALSRWDDAIEALYEWFRWTQEEDPLAYYLLGIANFQLGNFDLAIANTEKALEIANEPKEGWLQLLAALYVQGENYQKAAPIFEQLLTLYPKKSYWVQIGLIYGALEDYDTSLAVQQIAYAQDLLSEDKELRRLARSYLVADLPYPAAHVLEQGIDGGQIEAEPKALELLANSWIQAREFDRSLPPLVRAAEIAEDGNVFVRLGQVYLQGEAWREAADAFKNAIDKGELKKPGNAHLLLGIAYYNDAQSFRAKSSFIDALDFEATRTQAEQWIAHLEREAKTS